MAGRNPEPSAIRLRPGHAEDLTFLKEMLFEAFFWDPRTARPRLADFAANPEFQKLVSGWGRAGDRLVVAECDGRKVGAAWYRLWSPALHSYGFIDERTPELGLAVVAGHRSRGIGRMLMAELIRTARDEGHVGLSLSVSPGNHARSLYESFGFRRVGESGSSWTYLLILNS